MKKVLSRRQQMEVDLGQEPTMDIFKAARGTRVVFKYPDNGHDFQKVIDKRYLRVGGVYTIESVSLHDSSTDIFLQSFPGIAFNSVIFADVED